jgi:Ca2+-binding EF-hand superfamily protein
MQLDDDSLLALYYVYDPEGTGYLAYMDLVKHLMHPDTFCYYVGNVDNSQRAANSAWVKTLMGMVGRKFAPVVRELEPVLRAFDDSGCGYLSRSDLLAGCAALGVVVSENEFESMIPVLKTNSAGHIDYVHLCGLFIPRD